MKQDASAVDLFLGDDNNYVKLPGSGGVTLQTYNTSTFLPFAWTFGTDGTLTGPQTAINQDGSIIPRIDAVATLGTSTLAWDQIHVNNIKTGGNLDIATGASHSYWYSEYENVPSNSAEFNNSIVYDSMGNLYTFGVVWDFNLGHYDTLALKYDPDGNLVWRKAWIDGDGQQCGTFNQLVAIDSNDVIYWNSISTNNTLTTYLGIMDLDGNITTPSIRLDNFISIDMVTHPTNGQVYLAGDGMGYSTIVAAHPADSAQTDWVFQTTATSSSFLGIAVDTTLGIYALTTVYQESVNRGVALIYNLDPSNGDVINTITLDIGIDVGFLGNNTNIYSIAVNNGAVYISIDDIITKLSSDLSTIVWSNGFGITPVTITSLLFDTDNNLYVAGTSIQTQNTSYYGLVVAQLDDNMGIPVWAQTLSSVSGNTYAGFGFASGGVGTARASTIYQSRALAVTGFTAVDAVGTSTGHYSSAITLQLPIHNGGGPVGTYGQFSLENYNIGGVATTVTLTSFTTATQIIPNIGTSTNFIPDTVLINPDYVPVRYEISPGTTGWRFDTDGNLNIPYDGQLGWGITWPAVELYASTASNGVSLNYNETGWIYLQQYTEGGSDAFAGIELGDKDWYWYPDGTMAFPNNTLDTADQPFTIRNTIGSEFFWYNDNIQGLPNELLDSYVGVENGGAFIINSYINNDDTGTNVTVWNFGNYSQTPGGSNSVLQIGGLDEANEFIYDPTVDIQDGNGNSLIYVATTATAPGPRVEGQLWYNTQEGQLYIRHNNLWIDASPTVVPPTSTYLRGLTIEDTTISAVDSTGTVSILSGQDNVWTFNTTGTITFPDSSAQNTAWTGTIAYSNVTGAPSVGNFVFSGNTLTNSNTSTLQLGGHGWIFGTDGVLQMPSGNETTAGWIQWTHASDDLNNTAGIGFVDHYNVYTGLGLVAPTDTNAAKGIWFGTPTDPMSPFDPETSMVFRGNTLYLPKNGYIKSHDFDESSGYPELGHTGTSITIQTAETTSTQHNWTFGTDGGLIFPDMTAQGTAWLGAGSYDISNFNNGGTFTLPYSQLSGAPTNVSAFSNDAGYLTSAFSGNYSDLSGAPDLSGYVTGAPWETEGYLTGSSSVSASQITGLANVATSGNYTDLSGYPTNVSTFSNDAGYITSWSLYQDSGPTLANTLNLNGNKLQSALTGQYATSTNHPVTLEAQYTYNSTSWELTGTGHGYSTGMNIPTTGGSGTGMTVNIYATGPGQINSVQVNQPGTGYQNGDVISITGGDGQGVFVIYNYNSLNNSATADWTFGIDNLLNGVLTLPAGGYITAPIGMGSNTVIRAPASSSAILENNSGYNNVSASDSNVTIQTSPDSGTTLPTWVFGTDASTTIPGIVTLPNSGSSYGTEIKNTDGYVGGVQLNWTDQSLVRVDSNGINIITGGNGGPTWHFSGGDGGTLFTPGGVNIASNRTTNNSNPFISTSGAPVVIYTATSLSIIAVEIVVRALVDYGGSVELATIHAVKSPVNNTANIIVTGRVRQDGGSGSYGDTIYTVSLDGSNFLQVTAQPYGSNDANFIVTVTEFN
jgi:hypothetical protein